MRTFLSIGRIRPNSGAAVGITRISKIFAKTAWSICEEPRSPGWPVHTQQALRQAQQQPQIFSLRGTPAEAGGLESLTAGALGSTAAFPPEWPSGTFGGDCEGVPFPTDPRFEVSSVVERLGGDCEVAPFPTDPRFEVFSVVERIGGDCEVASFPTDPRPAVASAVVGDAETTSPTDLCNEVSSCCS